MTQLRWRLADDDGGQGALFEQEVERHVGRGEFRGLEFLHVRAGRVINEVPKRSRMPFRWTINAPMRARTAYWARRPSSWRTGA
jgi:hypothetical protein